MSAEEALLDLEKSTATPERGCMVVSDLCGSTAVLFKDARLGAGLQAAHETICADISHLATDSPRFKAMGDGAMLEVADPVAACRIALDLLDEAKRLRKSAAQGHGNRAFIDFHLKIVVAAGEFRRASGSQRWLGLLPTKAARIATFARPDEVWIDNEVASAIHGYLASDLNAVYDPDPGLGAAFLVPLKGLDSNRVTIHLLRRASEPCPLELDERKKVWLLPWSATMVGLKQIVEDIRASGFVPQRVVGIGRSGAILGGIIAGNLGQVAVDVIERRHLSKQDPRRAMSTLTEPEETYVGDQLELPASDFRTIWKDAERILLVIGEAKTELSFHSAKAWLSRHGAREVRTVALVKSKSAFADYSWVEAENAWLPWQFKPGYDLNWPTYAKSKLDQQEERARPLEEKQEKAKYVVEAKQTKQEVAIGVSSSRDDQGTKMQILYFCATSLILLPFLLLASLLSLRWLHNPPDPQKGQIVVSGFMALLRVTFVDWFGARSDAVRSWPAYIKFHEFKLWLLSLIGFVVGWQIVEMIGGTTIDWIKAVFHSRN